MARHKHPEMEEKLDTIIKRLNTKKHKKKLFTLKNIGVILGIVFGILNAIFLYFNFLEDAKYRDINLKTQYPDLDTWIDCSLNAKLGEILYMNSSIENVGELSARVRRSFWCEGIVCANLSLPDYEIRSEPATKDNPLVVTKDLYRRGSSGSTLPFQLALTLYGAQDSFLIAIQYDCLESGVQCSIRSPLVYCEYQKGPDGIYRLKNTCYE